MYQRVFLAFQQWIECSFVHNNYEFLFNSTDREENQALQNLNIELFAQEELLFSFFFPFNKNAFQENISINGRCEGHRM